MKKISQSIITKRVLWTLFFLFIYCLGNQLVLPFVDLKNANIFGGTIGSLAFSSAMMGGNLRSMSLFSVGLSPWMSAMILWQMFSFSKKMGLKNLPIEIQDRRRMYLALGIAIVQSLAVSLNLPIVSGVNASLAIFMNTILLIAGTFFLVWLSDLNSLFGIGGSIVILMASMMANLPYQIMDSIEKLGIGWNVLLPLILFSLVFLYVSGVVQRARYRISINKINIHNRFKQYSYLDIMLNPAGGMPFMYAMSLVSIPQYVFMLIQFIHPENKWTSGAIKALTVGQPLWLVVYLVMLFVLGLAFAFVNVSGEQISERMRKSGEYIYGVYPGQETSAYINHLVLRLGFIGALYMLFMAGAPMLIILVNPDYLQLSMIPGTFLIFSGMIYNVNEEMKALKLNTSYTPLFENV
ncbi:accessory Sec system protein translocase subunit SecY2 [Streptococcus salivarius]|uniref:Accessory Sec system protein translocase subunit SecY2 n=1 Tax=Streptococcus salivarius TaxID=1304 RepID=A0A448ACN9_STRSL|nr:accessory Sec system protein translocase subunit SecY2 [Streptococcus salivarius]CDF03175.1 accessory Sec system protein translocase subunit SecY2 [Streptococcus salivarius CAG:79]AIY21512.1 preprotein translocase subunit SecY [Streptococcus salivarius]AMB83106.1 accessory Sec system protein translocase subunit SecY2 [Streptococcus salivarius]MDB8614572.1 accessory Sec system protein translocase subunit SecY2 [Streptococcus salivarius]MTQ86977.1 accessory Sec system protein translocase subu